MLKPALASGRLAASGAPPAGYRPPSSATAPSPAASEDRDRQALGRRDHPDPRGLKPRYGPHHGVAYDAEALKAAAELSAKYVSATGSCPTRPSA